MSGNRLARHEVAPGCYIVSSAGTSRSGDTVADTVRAICEGALAATYAGAGSAHAPALTRPSLSLAHRSRHA